MNGFADNGRRPKPSPWIVNYSGLSVRVFLYEYTCAVAGRAALHAEGLAMLRAVAADFAALPGIRTVTLLAEGVADLGQEICRADACEELVFQRLAGGADYTLVIAPESAGVLASRCQGVLEAGGRLLGPTLAAVLLTGDKLRLARYLHAQGIPTPATWVASSRIENFGRAPSSAFPLVCKPRRGAGSQTTFLVPSRDELPHLLAKAREEMPQEDFLLQPYVPGQAASVAFLAGPATRVALLPAYQNLSTDGRMRYLGGTLPLPPDQAGRAVQLGRQAVQSVPGLQGYVGVDLVLGPAADGTQDYVIEINPRLTTSYIGLRHLAQFNLAEAMVNFVAEKPLPPITWRLGTVVFQSNGSVES